MHADKAKHVVVAELCTILWYGGRCDYPTTINILFDKYSFCGFWCVVLVNGCQEHDPLPPAPPHTPHTFFPSHQGVQARTHM